MKLNNEIFERPTTSLELQNICNHLNIKLNGIMMKDQLNTKNIKNGCYIINLENHNQDGSHWTALFKNKNKYYYADSFGVVPPQTLLDNLKINPNNLFYNDKQIQDLKSQRCGFYAIYFLYCISKNPIQEGLEKYINTFSFDGDERKNEKQIKKIFMSI
jgi:hypothetical protein